MFAIAAVVVFLAVTLFFNPFSPPSKQLPTHINTSHGIEVDP